jgi:ribosome biogenesis GTPase
MKTTLADIGFSDWFAQNADQKLIDQYQPARIIFVARDQYIIKGEQGEMPAEITGKLLYNASTTLDYPAVGDWVYVDYFDDNRYAVIHDLFPRRTILKRKTPGKSIGFQVIAANIDTALIVQSLDQDYSLPRLERYLVMVHETGADPIILLSKRDLIDDNTVNARISEIQKRTGLTAIHAFSNTTASGIDNVRQLLERGKTYCLLGSSGIGKSTLLNTLIGTEIFKTQSVREYDSKGRHTTTNRQMIFLENGAMLIDNPGMRELGNFAVDTGISSTFSDIMELSVRCKYSDCSHIHEKGCAVLHALKDGTLSRERYRNYIKMRKESDYFEMSYREKRQRDKNFGKMVKNVMKNKRNKP